MTGIDPRLIFQYPQNSFNIATLVPTIATVSPPTPSSIVGASSTELAGVPSIDASCSVPQSSRFYQDPTDPNIIRSTLTTQYLLQNKKTPTWTDCIEATISDAPTGALNSNDILHSILTNFADKKRVMISSYLSQSPGFERSNGRPHPLWHLTGKETRIIRQDKMEKRAEQKKLIPQESCGDIPQSSVGPHRTGGQKKKKTPPSYSSARSSAKKGSNKGADSEVNFVDFQLLPAVEPAWLDALFAPLSPAQNPAGPQSPVLTTSNNLDILTTFGLSTFSPNPATGFPGTSAYDLGVGSSLPVTSPPFSLFPSDNDVQGLEKSSTSQLQMNSQKHFAQSVSPLPVPVQGLSSFPAGSTSWRFSLQPTPPSLSSSSDDSSPLTTSNSSVSSPEGYTNVSNSTQYIDHMQNVNASYSEPFPSWGFNPYLNGAYAYQDATCSVLPSASSKLP